MRTVTRCLAAAALFTATLAGCGERGTTELLLDRMPSGYAACITFDPSETGMTELLDMLADSYGADMDLREAQAALGFSPLDWEGWSSNLSLREGEELGILLGTTGGDPDIVVLYLPSNDRDKVDGIFQAARTQGGLEVVCEQDGNYVTVAMARRSNEMQAFREAAGSPLRENGRFSDLRSRIGGFDAPAVEVWVDGSQLPDTRGMNALLASISARNGTLMFRWAAGIERSEFEEMAELTGDGPSGDATFPHDALGAFRITLDPNVLGGMLEGQVPSDALMALGVLGFSSADELLAMFSGDVWFAMTAEGGGYSGAISLGLKDLDAAGEFMTQLTALAGMAGAGDGVRTFSFSGSQALEIQGESIPGVDGIQIGIVGGSLVAAGGWTLQQVEDGDEFSAMLEGSGLDMNDQGPFVMYLDIGRLAENLGLEREPGLPGPGSMGALAFSSSLTEGSVAVGAGALDTGSENPFLFIIGILTRLGSM
ncbi:MAG: hypothetical protein R6U39_11795 [Candidatus Aegiribacteria sp.]